MYALLLVLACDSGEAPPPAPPPATVEAPPAPKVDGASLFAQGRYAEAAEALQKDLAASPQDAALWERLELAALRSNAPGAVLDRLKGDAELQKQVIPYRVLVGSLALAAGRPAEAVAAVDGLRGSEPGAAAWLMAAGVLAGAPAPEIVTLEETALIAWARDPKARLDPAAAGLAGWRLALWRGEQRLARGDRAGALEEAGRAEVEGERAKQEAALLRVRALATAEEVWYALEALKGASGDPAGAARVLQAGGARVMGSWRRSELLALAGELKKAAEEAKNGDAVARIGLVQAQAHLRLGHPLEARDALAAALELEALKAESAWPQAMIAATLGDAAAVEAAAGRLSGARQAAAQDLARAMRGEAVALPSAGLSGAEAAYQALIGAGWLADPRPARAAALQRAREAGEADLVIWAELVQDRRRLAISDTPAAQSEAAARGFLAGGSGGAVASDHPEAEGWKALLGSGAAGAASGTGGGVMAWPRARAALAAGDLATAAREYGTVGIAVPWWRTGPWEPLLALEGPTPEEFTEVEAGLLKGASDPLPMAVLQHGWAHRVDGSRQGWRVGAAPIPPGTIALKRESVWDAQAAHRAAVVAWVAGKGPAPKETLAALGVAEEQAGLTNFQPPSLTSVRSALTKGALLSIRSVPGKGGEGSLEVLLLTESKGKVFSLPGRTAAEIGQLLQELPQQKGAALGNRIRAQMLDPHMDVLLGIARYFVVGTGVAGALPLAALPEQQDAQRYLMEIRSVAHYQTFEQLIPAAETPKNYAFDMFAFASTPGEADAIRRVFPSGKIYLPEQATLALWREQAPQARYVHLGRLPSTPSGVKLPDGLLSYAEIAATPYAASGAFLWAEGADAATTRGMLLRRAGIPEVMVQGWGTSPSYHEHFVGYWWELQVGQGMAARAMSEARPRAMKEEEPVVRTQPEVWGGYYVMGRF